MRKGNYSRTPLTTKTVGGGGGASVPVQSTEPTDPAVTFYIDNSRDAATGDSAAGSTQWLTGRALSQAFRLTGSQVYDATYGTLTSSAFAWEDGTSGVYTATLNSNGYLVSFTATYVGSTTKTVTVVVPRNSDDKITGSMTVTVS